MKVKFYYRGSKTEIRNFANHVLVSEYMGKNPAINLFEILKDPMPVRGPLHQQLSDIPEGVEIEVIPPQ